jgi:hypothetical protein
VIVVVAVEVVVVVVAVDAPPPPTVGHFLHFATVVTLGLTLAPLSASIFLNMAKAALTRGAVAGGAAELPPGVVGCAGVAAPSPACPLLMARTEPGAMLTARLLDVSLLVICSGSVSSSGSKGPSASTSQPVSPA